MEMILHKMFKYGIHELTDISSHWWAMDICQWSWWLSCMILPSGLILGLHPANERRYKVTPSLIGWAKTLNQLVPWFLLPLGHHHRCPVMLHSIEELGYHWLRFVACSVPWHYLNRCWLVVNWRLGNKFTWQFNTDLHIFIKKKKKHLKMSSAKWPPFLFESQCVNP